MSHPLTPTFDALAAQLPQVEAECFQKTNRGLRDARWVPAVLTLLREHGFRFRFYTPREERTLAQMAMGVCNWFTTSPTGELLEDRELLLSSEMNSLDALRVASHEMAHALTLDPEVVKAEFGKGQEAFRTGDHYQWAEVVAEATATVVAVTLCPEQAPLLLQYGAQYVKGWRNAAALLEENRELVLTTAATILVEAGAHVNRSR